MDIIKITGIIVLFGLAGCDLAMPRLLVNYDHLSKSEISDFIIRKFPNNDENELKEAINAKLQNDYSASNIRKVVSDMGMTCNEKTDGCEYNGYVVPHC